MKKNKLTTFEAICFVLICMINETIFNISQNYINSITTGAIINLLYMTTIVFIFCLILNKLIKNFNSKDIIDISEFLGGKILKTVISIIFILFLITLSCFTISKFSYLLKSSYFKESPIGFICIFFGIVMLISNLFGLDCIKKINSILIPILVVVIGFIFVNSIEKYTPLRLNPIFGQNYKTTFLTGLINLFIFNIVLYYYFLPPLLDNTKALNKIIKISLVIFFILIELIMISILTIFPIFYNNEEINFIYMLTKNIELSNFIQRLDGVFILIWIFSFFSYISVLLFWILEILNKLFIFENKKLISFPVTSIIIGISIFIYNNQISEFTKTNIYKLLSIFIIFIVGLIILILANIKKIRQNKLNGGNF